MDLGSVGSEPVERHLTIAYDDVYSIEYFGRKLRAWWRRDEAMTAEKMLAAAERDYAWVMERCEEFDDQLVGGGRARQVRPSMSTCARWPIGRRSPLTSWWPIADGKPLFFSKENFSNGSIGTVDVTYPSAPLFLLYQPKLLKGMMEPIFYFSESGKWTKPFAAHDVGTYPQANGQTYPTDMPVEECGNMLILSAAIAQVEGERRLRPAALEDVDASGPSIWPTTVSIRRINFAPTILPATWPTTPIYRSRRSSPWGPMASWPARWAKTRRPTST